MNASLRNIRFWEACLSEYKSRDRPVLEDEGIVSAGRKANLVEKDEDAGCERNDGDHRRQLGWIIVVQRDHGALISQEGGDGR